MIKNAKIDPLKFQKLLKQKLEEKLKRSLNESEESDDYFNDEKSADDTIDENSDKETESEKETLSDENKIILDIMKAAQDCGVDITAYAHGVCQLDFDKKEEVDKFTDFIENYDNIESFEMKSCDEEGNESDEDSDDCAFYRFWIYLNPNVVSYDYFDDLHDESDEDESSESDEDESSESDEDESSESDEDEVSNEKKSKKINESYLKEMERKIKVNYFGKKRIKIQCSPGYKYNHDDKVCEKITGDQLITLRKAVRKTLLTKSQGGLALKRRKALRTKKADKFRTNYGL